MDGRDHVQELELLEDLIPPIVQNLEYRHSFVRRYAVLAISSLYRFDELV